MSTNLCADMGSVARGVLHVVVHAGSHADSSTEPLESAAVAAVQAASGALCSAGEAPLNCQPLPLLLLRSCRCLNQSVFDWQHAAPEPAVLL